MIQTEQEALQLARELANKFQFWYEIYLVDNVYEVVVLGDEPSSKTAKFQYAISPEKQYD